MGLFSLAVFHHQLPLLHNVSDDQGGDEWTHVAMKV